MEEGDVGMEEEEEDGMVSEDGERATDGSQNTGAGTFVVRLWQDASTFCTSKSCCVVYRGLWQC